jgi:tetratricopeptide (TPR) repeat protein
MISAGVLATSDDPLTVSLTALEAILGALDPRAPYERIEPLLEAMLAVAQTPDSLLRAYSAAVGRGYYEYALRALLLIPEEERSVAVSHDIAAMFMNLGRHDEAEAALEAITGKPDADDLYAQCHRAMIAAHGKSLLPEPAIDDLVARVRSSGIPALLGEALHAQARHRAARGDVPGALAAIDEAIGARATATLHLLRGDLLFDSDRALASEEWRKALAVAHPDGIEAKHARDRLADRPHAYRGR